MKPHRPSKQGELKVFAVLAQLVESSPLGHGVREGQSLKEILGSGQGELGSGTSSHAQL